MRSLLSVIKASQYGSVDTVDTLDAFALTDDNKKKTAAKPCPPELNLEEKKGQILEDAIEKAQQIVVAAQSYSENQIREATQRMNEESTQIKIRSREEGYRQGLQEGMEEGRATGYGEGFADGVKKAEEQNRCLAEELKRMLETVEQQKEEILQSYEKDIESLAFAIAQKIVKIELSKDSAAMQAIIKSATDAYRSQSWVKITVSKNTAELLARSDSSLAESLRDVSDHVKITISPEMNDGDCTIDMPEQMIDASVGAQMEKIKTALKL